MVPVIQSLRPTVEFSSFQQTLQGMWSPSQPLFSAQAPPMPTINPSILCLQVLQPPGLWGPVSSSKNLPPGPPPFFPTLTCGLSPQLCG